MIRSVLAAVALALGLALIGTPSAAEDLATASSSRVDSVHATADSALATSDAAAAPRDYVAEVRANFTPENRAYSSARVALRFFAPFYAVFTALLLLFTGVSARLRDFAYARARNRYLRVLFYLVPFLLIGAILDFPVSYYAGYALEHRYGLSNQSFGEWLGEEGKGLMMSMVLLGGTGIVALIYLAIQRSPRRWWLWLALGSLPVIILQVLIQPIFIDPVFNKFEPLKDEQLRGKILALAAKAEIPARRVYQVDKSRQTKKLNAYVTGFGASQRIVLWDTTLEQMKEDEILFVMGHEMGHYKLAHIWKAIAWSVVLSFGTFFVAWWIAGRLTRAFGARWGFTEVHDVASLPMMVAISALLTFLAAPISNFYTRRAEHEADIFALEVTRANDAGARAFIQLGAANKSNPEPPPFLRVMNYSHPPLIERIRFALEYKPWEEGRPNQAFKPAK